MRNAIILSAALVAAALALPAAVADHGDPLHGVAPHSVSASPTDIHAVAISTPHPYEIGVSYTWSVTVEGADSLSIHFERLALNGYFAWWDGTCYGSMLRVVDAATGEAHVEWCGAQSENDVWTPAMPTDSVVIELVTDGWESAYGFDVYEVATNGAQPIASVPYSSTPSAGVFPGLDVSADPFAPDASRARVDVLVLADWGPLDVDVSQAVSYGTFWHCRLSCEEIDGSQADGAAYIGVGDETFVIGATAVLVRDDAAPGGVALGDYALTCERNGSPC